MLRDEGFNVELSDHPSHAVQLIMKGSYAAAILDSQAFGMPADEAARIINTIAPEMKVILTGLNDETTKSPGIWVPFDLENLRSLVHCMQNTSAIS